MLYDMLAGIPVFGVVLAEKLKKEDLGAEYSRYDELGNPDLGDAGNILQEAIKALALIVSIEGAGGATSTATQTANTYNAAGALQGLGVELSKNGILGRLIQGQASGWTSLIDFGKNLFSGNWSAILDNFTGYFKDMFGLSSMANGDATDGFWTKMFSDNYSTSEKLLLPFSETIDNIGAVFGKNKLSQNIWNFLSPDHAGEWFIWEDELTRSTREKFGVTANEFEDARAMAANIETVRELLKQAHLASLIACFSAQTKVHTETGLVEMQYIQPGTNVYSYNERTREIELNQVKQVFKSTSYRRINIGLSNGEIIETTKEHPFYTTEGFYKEAKSLSESDTLLVFNSNQITIESMSSIDGPEQVFNIEVANNHNYYAGNAGALVHNESDQPAASSQTIARFQALMDKYDEYYAKGLAEAIEFERKMDPTGESPSVSVGAAHIYALVEFRRNMTEEQRALMQLGQEDAPALLALIQGFKELGHSAGDFIGRVYDYAFEDRLSGETLSDKWSRLGLENELDARQREIEMNREILEQIGEKLASDDPYYLSGVVFGTKLNRLSAKVLTYALLEGVLAVGAGKLQDRLNRAIHTRPGQSNQQQQRTQESDTRNNRTTSPQRTYSREARRRRSERSIETFSTPADELLRREGVQHSGRYPRNAEPNAILYRRNNRGEVTSYQVYDNQGLPIKRVDVRGKSHGPMPTPHVEIFEYQVNPHTGGVYIDSEGVRRASPTEYEGLR